MTEDSESVTEWLIASRPAPAKACKSSQAAFPLHPRDAELEIIEIEPKPAFLHNILPRLQWSALVTLCAGLRVAELPGEAPEVGVLDEEEDGKMKAELHRLLLETTVKEGALICGNCGHEYRIKEGIANFLLPSHLV
ncbi:hypothetical protein W97_03425 [Coniosporium apollinis CBS 100218]|uniref:Trm112p-domain-containing protein n=1 Tax=Coniosporium apollinis (strain CBS 100218) TaxID=1168221 RepID=R7YQJ8_CONA1|nr:uncharacterized protein W97_03425 [Coniosporium apollinis CBS 100218]EON64195.1 hypothetical protein W97_03425 [Coniosporium apollinis CBS 100218]